MRKRKRILLTGGITFAVVFVVFVFKEICDSLSKVAERSFRHGTYYKLFEKWFSLKEEEQTLEKFFAENRMNNIAIYGMGMLGKHLVKDLKNSKLVSISYGIDRAVEKNEDDIKIYKPEDCLPEVDAIVVTAIFDYDEVADTLKDKVSCPIIVRDI